MKSSKKLLLFLYASLVATMMDCGGETTNTEAVKYKKPQERKLDSTDKYLIKIENLTDKNYIKTYTERVDKYIKKGEIDSAALTLEYVGNTYSRNYEFNEALLNTQISFLEKYEKQLSARYLVSLNYSIGNLYNFKSGESEKYEKTIEDSSMYYFNKGILIEPTDYYTTYHNAYCYYMLFEIYANRGNSENSMEAGLKALKGFESVGNKRMQAVLMDGISELYRYYNDYAEAIELNTKAYRMALSGKDSSIIKRLTINRLHLLDVMAHPDFLQFIDSASVFANSYKNIKDGDKFVIKSFEIIKLTRQKKLDKARQVLEETKGFYKQKANDYEKMNYEWALAEYELAKGQGSSNIKLYEKLISENKDEDIYSFEDYYEILRDDAVLKKNYEKAYNYQRILEKIDDTLSNIRMRVNVRNLDKKYQTEKKEQEIANQKIVISQKNTSIYALVASLIGLLLAGLIYYLWQKQKTLKQQKENSMTFTKQLLENTEDERKRIASDLHDSISHELLDLKSMLKGNFSELGTKVDTIINDVRSISRNLHPVMFEKTGLVLNIEQLVDRIQVQNNFFITSNLSYSNGLNTADELQVYRIIQEALTNVIKYSEAHAAKIEILEDDNHIRVLIQDNGKGFRVTETLNSGKAFGLHNIIERSKLIGGQAVISSSLGGTIITINIPKKS